MRSIIVPRTGEQSGCDGHIAKDTPRLQTLQCTFQYPIATLSYLRCVFEILLKEKKFPVTDAAQVSRDARKNRGRTARSLAAFKEAGTLFPGGVNSPVRSWKSVGGEPFFVAKAKGTELVDLDGNRYIDFIGSWGAMILGHCQSKVVAAVRKQATRGFSFGAPTELESRLGSMVRKAFPSLEKMRFVSSGTEACMHALRVARGFT